MDTAQGYNHGNALKTLLYNCDIPNNLREDLGLAPLMAVLTQIGGYGIVIYGAGANGYYALRCFRACGVEPSYVIDRDPAKRGGDFYGITIIGCDDFTKIMAEESRKIVAVVAVGSYEVFAKPAIDSFLLSAGCDRIIGMTDIYCGIDSYSWWAHKLISRKQEFLQLNDKLGDEESRATLYEYLRCVIQDDVYRKPYIPSREKYFGDGIFELSSQEYLVNCGMERGDTIFYFLARQREFSRIVGIESDLSMCQRAEDNMAMLPEHLRKKINIHYTWLGGKYGTTLDALLADEKITLLALDAEGAELDILRGAQRSITEQEPVLALCAYHTIFDLIELPYFIESMSSNYHFFLRKYSPAGRYITKDELLLYAVPEKRLTKSS